MNNAEPHFIESTAKQPSESNWNDLPLFSPKVTALQNNAAPQNSNLSPEEKSAAEQSSEISAEPQKLSGACEIDSYSTYPLIAPPPVIENSQMECQLNAAPSIKEEKENASLHAFENAAPHKAEKAEETKNDKAAKPLRSSKPARRKKSRSKSPEKKVRSQKRIAVPLKIFASVAEKAELESKAEKRGCSLSNYIRLHLGLALNEAGRKRQITQAAFNLED